MLGLLFIEYILIIRGMTTSIWGAPKDQGLLKLPVKMQCKHGSRRTEILIGRSWRRHRRWGRWGRSRWREWQLSEFSSTNLELIDDFERPNRESQTEDQTWSWNFSVHFLDSSSKMTIFVSLILMFMKIIEGVIHKVDRKGLWQN